MESLDPDNLRDMGKSWNLAGGSYAESLQPLPRSRPGRLRHVRVRLRQRRPPADRTQRRVRPRAEAVPGGVQSPDPVSGHAALSPLAATRAGCSSRAGGSIRPAGSATSPSVPRSWSQASWRPCAWSRRQRFYSWGSIWQRLWDGRANARSLMMLGIYLGLNLGCALRHRPPAGASSRGGAVGVARVSGAGARLMEKGSAVGCWAERE